MLLFSLNRKSKLYISFGKLKHKNVTFRSLTLSKIYNINITSHHIEKADAGLDRPLYLRNKSSDKDFKITKITNLLYCDYQCHGELPHSYRVLLGWTRIYPSGF